MFENKKAEPFPALTCSFSYFCILPQIFKRFVLFDNNYQMMHGVTKM